MRNLHARSAAAVPGWVAAALFLLLLLGATPAAQAGRLSGYAAGEVRWFPRTSLYPEPHAVYGSLVLQPEWYADWDGGRQSFEVIAFGRYDSGDEERTHADLRRFLWRAHRGPFELRAGVHKVFWGVTESQHLVDVINQTDLVENLDGEEKLGQPMVGGSWAGPFGTFDLFWLPYFRERTYPGLEGRPRFPVPVLTDEPVYESAAEEWHQDFALRWANSFGSWDVGLSGFAGTSRDPWLEPRADSTGALTAIVPHYNHMWHAGLDAQYTSGGWLLKLETIARETEPQDFVAATGGYEYTFFGLGGSSLDLGVLTEYLYDSRGTGVQHPFENDLFFGGRLTWNDVQSTSLLAGGIVDPSNGTTVLQLEAERRLGSSWKGTIEMWGSVYAAEEDPLYLFRRDPWVQISLARYF